jgi:uncharacterized protein with ATP-grasp and redox domains
LLDTCSTDFQERFERADLVVAKGQANFETLDECGREIFFLLKIKCPLVGHHIGHEVGSLVVKRNVSVAQAIPHVVRVCPAGVDTLAK